MAVVDESQIAAQTACETPAQGKAKPDAARTARDHDDRRAAPLPHPIRYDRLRQHDDPPHTFEIVIPLVIWAVVFEVVLPTTETFTGLAVPDPNDVLCYALGGFVSAQFWQWWHRRRVTPGPAARATDRSRVMLNHQPLPMASPDPASTLAGLP